LPHIWIGKRWNSAHRWEIESLKDLDAIVDILKLVILSAYVRSVTKPVSLLIIAKPESGKTDVMKKFAVNKNIAYLSDVTAYGIQRDYLNAIENREVRHIMIPDLLKPLSRKESTVNTFITLMNSLIEEGIAAVSTYATPRLVYSEPVKCGLITAIASDEFHDHRHKWKRLGFLSRTIPFSYSYGIPTVNKVFQYIIGLDYLKEHDIHLEIPERDKDIKLPREYAQAILPSTASIAQAEEMYGFRLQKQFQALLQASALDHRRKSVNKSDVGRILRLMNWVNFDERPIA
jgi:hypothetical protein